MALRFSELVFVGKKHCSRKHLTDGNDEITDIIISAQILAMVKHIPVFSPALSKNVGSVSRWLFHECVFETSLSVWVLLMKHLVLDQEILLYLETNIYSYPPSWLSRAVLNVVFLMKLIVTVVFYFVPSCFSVLHIQNPLPSKLLKIDLLSLLHLFGYLSF